MASLALHLGLIAMLPAGCIECDSIRASGNSRLDARLAVPASVAVAAESTGKEESADFVSDAPQSLEKPSIDGSTKPAVIESTAIAKPGEAYPPTADAVPVFAGSEYFPTTDLQIRPHPIRPIEPTIPDNADPREIKVVLRIWISADGKVDRVVTLSGPTDERFSRSAATAFAMSRFSPGVKNGVPVGTEMTVEVVFDRETVAESRSSAQR